MLENQEPGLYPFSTEKCLKVMKYFTFGGNAYVWIFFFLVYFILLGNLSF